MPSLLVRQSKWSNLFQMLVLVAALGCLNVVVGWLMLGGPGVWMAVFLTLLGAFLSPGISPVMVMRMFHARPISHPSAPELCELFSELKRRARLSRPVSLFYVPSRVPNAFAAGNSQEAAVAVSDGLLRLLPPRELAGVLAHELAHIRNNDLQVMATADAVARVTSLFARVGFVMLLFGLPAVLLGMGIAREWLTTAVVLFLAPAASALVQLALSRSREFNADLGAVELTHDPRGLAMALERIEHLASGGWMRRIFGNLPDRSQPALLRTHPPTAERVQRLLEVERSLRSLAASQPGELGPPHFVPAVRHLTQSLSPPIHRGPAWHAITGLWY